MSINNKSGYMCCGCMCCSDVCPVNAISKSIDENGFLVPKVDPDMCIECGKCEASCAFNNDATPALTVKSAYAYKLADPQGLKHSSSGGAFTALSNQILEKNGAVFGSELDESLTVKHTLAFDKEQRDRMRLSKYVQSDTFGIFAKVKELVDKNIPVLFVGTPCQTSQLYSFIGEHPKLVTCDFICHGVPSQSLFSAHIDYLEKRYNKKAVNYTFRSKRYGWNHGIDEIVFLDGSRNDSMTVQSFTRLFQGNISLRDACISCPYAGDHHNSDITIADFWGYEKICGKEDIEGVSLILVNTDKGAKQVSELVTSGSLMQIDLDKIKHRLDVAEFRSIFDVETFRTVLRNEGYESAIAKALSNSLKKQVKFNFKKKVLKIKCRH